MGSVAGAGIREGGEATHRKPHVGTTGVPLSRTGGCWRIRALRLWAPALPPMRSPDCCVKAGSSESGVGATGPVPVPSPGRDAVVWARAAGEK